MGRIIGEPTENIIPGSAIVPPKIDPIITDTTLLRKKSKPTTYKECEKLGLFARLKASNDTAWCKGAGLAAVQIGLYIRAAWYKIEDKEYELVNPKIVAYGGKIINREGCLSIPDVWVQTERWGRLIIASEDKNGLTFQREVKNFEALIVQHEIDHMDGILLYQRKAQPVEKIGRNEPCPCGSGKKYKKCCIDKGIGIGRAE